MNRNFLESRYSKIVLLIIVLMVILGIRLFVLTVVQNEKWGTAAEKQSTETIYTSAARGDILDRNGKILATNKQIFTVNFNASGLTTEEINKSAYALINKLDEKGDKYKDEFPIKISEDGEFSYTFTEKVRTWLRNQGLSADTKAEVAFEQLRQKYKIDSTLDRFDALKVLKDEHNVNPPITVKTMKYSYDEELENFLKRFGFADDEIKKGIDAKTCFTNLREKYNIDKGLSDLEARKIFIIRDKISSLGFMKYKPIKIASGVSNETVAYVEENNGILKGVEISSETIRQYPNGSLASHILGYMGNISEDKIDEYVNQKGYRMTDLIGKDGVEAAYESSLKGKDGEKKVLVNASGEYIDTISKTDAEKGKNVYLTIDSDLQKRVESTLKMTVDSTNGSGGFRGSYGSGSPVHSGNCQSGSIVVLDVKTGEVLSLANYPDYDPNIFANGITEKAWESVQSKNSRDSLSPTPLVNMAATASIQPGSIFKPITAISALKAGLDPNRTIYDGRFIDLGGRKFGCDLYNNGGGGSHGAQTLAQGLGNSCNYYFYCAGTGVDYNNNTSLGYEISNNDIMKTAKDFGLGSETGIELYESVADLPSESRKLQSTKVGLWTYIYNNAKNLFPSDITNDYDKLHSEIDEIVSWLDNYPSRDEIATQLKNKSKVNEDQIEALADTIKYSYVDYSKWTLGDSFNICIGQGDNAYTPLQMARFVSGIGNGGKLNKLNLIKAVEGQGATDKDAPTDTGVSEEQLSHVIQGMHNVTTIGTLSSVFSSFSLNIPVAAKTGTAEKDGKIQPKDEVEYIKSHLSALSSVSWDSVEETMKKLMKDNPDSYKTENDTVDDALIQASGGKVTQESIDSFKGSYSDFAWTMALAPADKPEIAVVVLLVQGNKSYNAGLAAREVIGDYFTLPKNNDYTNYSNGTRMN